MSTSAIGSSPNAQFFMEDNDFLDQLREALANMKGDAFTKMNTIISVIFPMISQNQEDQTNGLGNTMGELSGDLSLLNKFSSLFNGGQDGKISTDDAKTMFEKLKDLLKRVDAPNSPFSDEQKATIHGAVDKILNKLGVSEGSPDDASTWGTIQKNVEQIWKDANPIAPVNAPDPSMKRKLTGPTPAPVPPPSPDQFTAVKEINDSVDGISQNIGTQSGVTQAALDYDVKQEQQMASFIAASQKAELDQIKQMVSNAARGG